MTDPFLLTANRNCPIRKFLRKKTSFGYFCWETPIINLGWKCLLNTVSHKLISYDFCTSFVLHKVKKTFGGSKGKLIELTRVCRYLAHVTRTHDWRIRVCCRQLKNLMEVKKTDATYKKPVLQGKMDAVVQHTSWYAPERSVSYLWRGRLEVLTLS